MKSIDNVVECNKCTGCGACANICPLGAISMIENHEGFFVPKIDKNKCTSCGLCDRTCPMLKEVLIKNQYKVPMVYAGWNKNEKIRLESSSGGVFSVLAEYIFKKKGYVCGAAFDDKNHLKHIIVSNKKDLQKLRGSKYVQSEIGNVFYDIKKLLNKNKYVLFSGTPCQVAGLKNFLKNDYEKLLAIDLVCHGVPSPRVFKKYICEIEKVKKCKIDQIDFREKSTGWKDYSFQLSDDKKIILNCKHNDDLFFKGFLKNLFLNKICTGCPFSKFPKCSDITLGDFWGIWNYKKELDDDKGVSCIIINNKKGLNFLNKIDKNIFYKKINKEKTIEKLLTIYNPCDAHQNREEFFKNLDNNNISEKINLNLCNNIDFDEKNVAILNMRFPTNNYGAILQSFALSEIIKKLGYKPKVINYISKELNKDRDNISISPLDKFREEKIQYTLPCYSVDDLINLNKNFNTFVVGSDQVWNYNYLNSAYKNDIGRYFLNFVSPLKNIFSYAASMAENHWDGDENEVKIVKNALNHFSAISVREKSGVYICKNLFDVKAKCVLDPTLLLKQSDYQKIIELENIKQNDEKYFAYFTLDSNLEENITKNEVLKKFINKNKLQLKNVRGEIKKVLGQDKFIYNSVPSWLNYIKNCEFIITDSYHCVIFAILFKKQFIVIERGYAGNERLNSLLSILQIKNRFYPSLEDIQYDYLLNDKIDYVKVYKKLNIERNKSTDFLKKSLEIKMSDSDKTSKLEEEFITIKINEFESHSQNQTLLSRSQELESQNQTLLSRSQELESQNIILKNNIKQLTLGIKAYKKTKTYKYSKKIKKVLIKIGIKRYKL